MRRDKPSAPADVIQNTRHSSPVLLSVYPPSVRALFMDSGSDENLALNRSRAARRTSGFSPPENVRYRGCFLRSDASVSFVNATVFPTSVISIGA